MRCGLWLVPVAPRNPQKGRPRRPTSQMPSNCGPVFSARISHRHPEVSEHWPFTRAGISRPWKKLPGHLKVEASGSCDLVQCSYCEKGQILGWLVLDGWPVPGPGLSTPQGRPSCVDMSDIRFQEQQYGRSRIFPCFCQLLVTLGVPALLTAFPQAPPPHRTSL